MQKLIKILWNLKAFTVLMKERDPELKRFIIDLEEVNRWRFVENSENSFERKKIQRLRKSDCHVDLSFPHPQKDA